MRASRRWPGAMICAMLEHEFGHLAGRRHTSDPADVMYDGSVPWTEDCTVAFPPPRALSRLWSCRLKRGADMTLT